MYFFIALAFKKVFSLICKAIFLKLVFSLIYFQQRLSYFMVFLNKYFLS